MFLTLILLVGASTAVFAGKSTLGDYVWIDYNNNDLPDDGPTGINGVVVNVYKDDGNGIFSPTIDSLVAISTTINEPANVDGDNTNPGEPGFYDVSVNDGDHWVHLPASNFAPGGALEGLTYTGSGLVLPDGSVVLLRNVPIQGDIDTADFGFVPVDWGDLPDGVSPNSPDYNTDSTGTIGANHVITPGLRIGSSVDAETNGQPNATATGDDSARTPDDENGVTLPPLFVAGQSATFTVTVVNTTGVPATLYGFVDWNGDGDFLDSVEKLTVTIPSNAGGTIATLTYGVPTMAMLTEQVGVRFRLSTDATLGADGLALNGEVEDYLIQVVGYDWGDLPDGNATTSPNYHTDNAGAIVGPSHLIDPDLRLGATEDPEANGQPNSTATGDDTMTSADENGIAAFPQFVAGSSAVISVNALNNTGSAATLYGFIDWNADGDFGDTGEQVSVNVPNGTNGAVPLNITVPLTASTTSDFGARFRLSTQAGLGAYGPASDGEVEDYLLQAERFDLALRKVKSAPAGGVLPGGLITFTFTISNQGTVDARNIQVTDYITGGFTFTPNNGWSAVSATEINTTIAGPLAAGQSTTKILVLQVATNYYGAQLTNYGEISSADDDGNPATPPPTDVDSTPDTNNSNDGTPKDDVTNENHRDNPTDDEDDHDPSVVPVAQIRDLAIEKTTNMVDVRPGDLVTFTIVITNEGTAPATNIQVTDTFTNAFQVPVGNALNTANGWTGTASPLVTVVAGPLNPGATTTRQIVLRVDPAYRGSQLTNTASIPPDDNPPGEPPDDTDPELVPVKYFDLALIKRAGISTVEPGKTVTFTLEIYNQGTLPAYNIGVSDSITPAFVFTPAVALNNGWTAVSPTLLNKTIAGPLAPGMMTTTQLVLQVPSSYTITSIITNTAEISGADDDTIPGNTPPTDVDSTPDTNPTNDGPMTDNVVNNTNGDQDDSDPAPVLVTYNPTAVQITKGAVRQMANGMEVSWATVSESEVVGFNLYRQVNGQLQKVNSSMIAAQKPGQATGASYQFMDSGMNAQSMTYVLEILSSDGQVGYVGLSSNGLTVKLFAPLILLKK